MSDYWDAAGLPRLGAVPLALTPDQILGLDVSGLPGGPARLESADVDDLDRLVLRGYLAPQVNFELALPRQTWSQRFLLKAPSGYGGVAGYTAHPSSPLDREGGALSELVVATHDTGHRSLPDRMGDAVWAVGAPQSVIDFAYAATHRVAQFTKALIQLVYGQPARYSYLFGYSNGGREALASVQRFPGDFDGVIAEAPTLDMVATNSLWHGWNARVNTGDDGYPILTSDKLGPLHQAVLQKAEREGALVGRHVEDPRRFDFDPVVLLQSDRHESDRLSPHQVDVVRRLYAGPSDSRGTPLFPGGLPIGSELGWLGFSVPEDPRAPMTADTSIDVACSGDFPDFMGSFGGSTGLRAAELDFSVEQFDVLHELAPLFDPVDPDIRAFADTGGKLLVWQGWADCGSSPNSVLNYWSAVVDLLGRDRTDEVMALYLVPGLYHGGHGPDSTYGDYLAPLLRWVETGVRPSEVEVRLPTPADAKGRTLRRVSPFDGSDGLPRVFEWEGLKHYRAGHTRWGHVPRATISEFPRSEQPRPDPLERSQSLGGGTG